jgi:hypothetical protein
VPEKRRIPGKMENGKWKSGKVPPTPDVLGKECGSAWINWIKG